MANRLGTVSEREIAGLKEHFAQKLYQLLVNRGWSQADFARRAGFTPNQVSTWINARVLPSPHSLMKMTQIFNIEANELVPGHGSLLDDPVASPTVDMRVVPGRPNAAHLHVSVIVPTTLAAKIIGMISDQQTSD